MSYEDLFLEKVSEYLRGKWLSPSVTMVSSRLSMLPSALSNRLQQGLYRSVFKGTGLEFLEVREYSYGDDPRNIDWNVSARFGKLFVRTFLEEKEIPIFFLLDMHLGMLFGKSEARLERALESMAFLMSLALRISEKMGLWVFLEKREPPLYLPPLKGPKQSYKIMSAVLESLLFAGDSSLIKGLKYFLSLTRKRSFAFIFSDFLRVISKPESREELLSLLRAMRLRHDVFCFFTLDELDFELPDVGVVKLRDLSSPQVIEVDTSDEELKKAYRERTQSLLRGFISVLEGMGVDWVISYKREDLWRNILRMLERRRFRILRR